MINARLIAGSVLILFGITGGIFSQEAKKVPVGVPSQEIQNIINETYSLDAEYAIDILLKIVRSGKLPDKQWQEKLLAESFRRLDEVQRPNKQKLALTGIPVDNRQVRLSEAFERKLDALSFRGEILRRMLKVDAKEARRLAFDTSFVPRAKTLSCEDALSDEFDPYYEVIAEIARTSFSPTEIRDQARIIALGPLIDSITTVAQITSVGKMITSVDAEKGELNQLLLAYGSAIRNMQPSDREFSASLWSYDWIRQFMSVLKVCEGKGIQCSFLKDSLNGFIVRNFRSERCADNLGTYREYAPGLLKYLNAALFSGAPLKPDDLKPSAIGDAAKLDPYGESIGAKRLGEKYRVLRWKRAADGESERPLEEKFRPEWMEKFEELLEEIDTWNGEGEKSPAAFFHQKCIYYRTLYELAPPGNLQAKTLKAFGNFALNDPIRKESRIEWFYWVERYMQAADQTTGAKYELLDNSRSPVVRLYAAVKEPAVK